MARRLRIQFPGAIYHLINRGNYRRDLFATVGAAKAFECALGEASTRFDWANPEGVTCELSTKRLQIHRFHPDAFTLQSIIHT